jgi:hypothetical protein
MDLTDFYYGKPGALDFADVVRLFPENAFASPMRSTVPLLAYWKDAPKRLYDFASITHAHDLVDAQVCFEYPVASVGANKASYTDVMAIAPKNVVAIEGKWTESVGPTVGNWLLGGKKRPNRERVLGHWLQLIEKETGHAAGSDVNGVVYQLVHRVASACSAAEGTRRVQVVLQVFADRTNVTRKRRYEAILECAARALDPHGKITFWLLLVPPSPTEAFKSLVGTCVKMSREDRVAAVRRALVEERLFSMLEETWVHGSR